MPTMRRRVASVTLALPLSALDTEATDTFASRATSLIVTAMQSPPPDRALHVNFLQSCGAAECKRLHGGLQKHCNIIALGHRKRCRSAAIRGFCKRRCAPPFERFAAQHKKSRNRYVDNAASPSITSTRNNGNSSALHNAARFTTRYRNG